MTQSVFLLTITTYVDDYKLRGNSWSETSKPRAFATKEKAEEQLAKYLKKYMYDEIAEAHQGAVPPFVTSERWKQVGGNRWELHAEHTDSLEVIEEEVAPFVEGECVSVRLSWDITKARIEA